MNERQWIFFVQSTNRWRYLSALILFLSYNLHIFISLSFFFSFLLSDSFWWFFYWKRDLKRDQEKIHTDILNFSWFLCKIHKILRSVVCYFAEHIHCQFKLIFDSNSHVTSDYSQENWLIYIYSSNHVTSIFWSLCERDSLCELS